MITHSVSFVHGATLLRAVASIGKRSPRIYFDGGHYYAEHHYHQDGRSRISVVRVLDGHAIADEVVPESGILDVATTGCFPDEVVRIADLDALVAEDPDLVLTTMVVTR
jgi:hypothetical protein